MSDVKVNGLAALEQALQELPAKISRNILRSALRQGGKVIAEQAKTLSPKRTGKLRDSIRVKTRITAGQPVATISAGGNKRGDAFYAQIVEFGSKAHLIKPKKGKALAFAGGAHGVVHHPGAHAKPFMRPALDSAAQAAVLAFGEQIRKRLTKEGIDTPDLSVDEA